METEAPLPDCHITLLKKQRNDEWGNVRRRKKVLLVLGYGDIINRHASFSVLKL